MYIDKEDFRDGIYTADSEYSRPEVYGLCSGIAQYCSLWPTQTINFPSHNVQTEAKSSNSLIYLLKNQIKSFTCTIVLTKVQVLN